MASSCGAKRRQGGEARCRCRCRNVHVHYHLPRTRRRVSLLRWLPRRCLSLLSYLLIPPVLFFALLAFVVLFLWFTLLYFVASLLSKDDNLESVKNGGIEDSGQEGNSEAKGKAPRHAAEHLTGDSATAQVSFGRLEIKEVRAHGFSQASRTNDDKLVEDVNILETSTDMVDSEEFSGWRQVRDVPVDWFVDEHNFRVASSSTSGDLFPSLYSSDSAEIPDLPDMDETRGISSDFPVERKQDMVVPSSTSSHHHNISDEYDDDRKELSARATYEIIDFMDKHETRDPSPDSSFADDEKTGQFESSDGSAHGRVPDEPTKGSTQEKDANSVLELDADGVATLEEFREKQQVVQKVPEFLITEANAEQSVGASNEVEDPSSEKEASMVSLHSVCEDTTSSDASSHHYLVYEDDKLEEVTKNNTAEAPDPASAVVCDIFENRQTPRREAFDGFENDDEAREVASQESLGDEADKINDDSASELNLKGAHCGGPLLRRSPSQWWNLCGVVDVFAGSED